MASQSPPAHASEVPGYRGLGAISSPLSAPTGVATDSRERIIVTESSSDRLLVFGADGQFLTQRTGLAKPTGVAAAPDGRILVGSAGRRCVDVYDGNLALVRTLGRGNGEFALPLGIAVDARGIAYVADGKEDRVKVYDAAGAFLFSFGGTGDGDGRLRFPTAVASDDVSQEIVVVDLPATAGGSQGARVQVFSRDGVFKRRFASFGLGEGLLVKPLGVAVDGAGRTFVADAYQNVVQVFDGSGAYLFAIHDGLHPLRTPLGIAVGPRSGKLYVASLNTSNVVVFGAGDGSGDSDAGSGGATLTFESRGGSCSVGATSYRAASYGTAMHLLLPALWLLRRRRRAAAGESGSRGDLDRREPMRPTRGKTMAGRLPGTVALFFLFCAVAAPLSAATSPFSLRSLAAMPGAVLYPHVDPGKNMSCENCHYLSGANPYLLPDWAMQPPVDIDDTIFNNLCRHCHNDITAPFARTHSSLATSARYGTWTVECRACHDPHRQEQAYVYGDAAHLVEGTVLSVTDNTLTAASGGWTDNQYKGLVLVPNIAQQYFAYKIERNSGSTLYVSSPMTAGGVAPGDTFAVIYGKLLRSAIAAPSGGTMPVRLFRGSGTNSLADGDATYDGACEVCHAKTVYHLSSGQGSPHRAGERCTRCHTHATGFKGAAGGAHPRHVALLSCDSGNQGCHGSFQPPLFSDGQNIAGTSACNGCHSPGGAYDGVNDPAIGAKANWDNGVYAGNDLAAGKEKWCATCHDEGSSVVGGVAAPNVIGDEDGSFGYGTGWGYYKTGHGLPAGVYPASREPAANLDCTACHDPGAPHVDNNHRTYAVADNNYQAGYRLKRPMDIPRTDLGMPASDFQLCVDCHSPTVLLTQTDNTTNFRKDPTMPNSHWLHLQAPATGQWAVSGTAWDSDWNGSQDSKISCPACHNVHGSVSPRMLRHGELISTPGTTDKVPSLNARYYPTAPPYPPLPNSTGLGFYPTVLGQGSVANTGVCFMCHANNVAYYRTVTNPAPRITSVHGRAGSNVLTVVFSERVYANPDNTGALVAGDFAFTDADNGRTITGATHAAGAETALLTLSSALDSVNDVGVDALAAATAGSIHDNQAEPMATTPVTLSGEGPYTLTLHPCANAFNYTGWNPQSTPSGGTWATVMDSGDGDLSYVTSGANMAGDTYYFTMDMDDAAALAPATIQSITITVSARHVLSGSPYAAYVKVGYKTGTTLVWSGSYLTDTSGNYTEIPLTYATDSDGGPLVPADVDNLQVSVMRGNTNGSNACYTRVTEIKVDVNYLYQQ